MAGECSQTPYDNEVTFSRTGRRKVSVFTLDLSNYSSISWAKLDVKFLEVTDYYARYFEVYVNGGRVLRKVISRSTKRFSVDLTTQIKEAFETSKRAEIEVVITTYVGYWKVHFTLTICGESFAGGKKTLLIGLGIASVIAVIAMLPKAIKQKIMSRLRR